MLLAKLGSVGPTNVEKLSHETENYDGRKYDVVAIG
jgi:hypothetical protein